MTNTFSPSETIIIYIYIYPCAAPTCVVLLQAAHTLCLCSVLCMLFLMTNMSLILCACARVYMFTPDEANFYMIYIFVVVVVAHYLLVSRFTGVHFNMACMNVLVLKIL